MPIYRDRDTTGERERITRIETSQGTVTEVYANHDDGNGEQLVWTQDETSLTSLASYRYDASSLRFEEGESIHEWPESRNGFDATQPLASEQPTFSASGIGGNPSVSFDGTQYLSAGVFETPLTQPYTIATVADFDGSDSNSYLYSGPQDDGYGDDYGATYQHASGPVNDRSFLDLNYRDTDLSFWAGTTGGVRLPTPTEPVVIIAVADGVDSVLRIDTVEETGDAGLLSQAGLTLGAHANGDSGLSGLIGEFNLFDMRLTGTERDSLAETLAENWGLSLSYSP